MEVLPERSPSRSVACPLPSPPPSIDSRYTLPNVIGAENGPLPVFGFVVKLLSDLERIDERKDRQRINDKITDRLQRAFQDWREDVGADFLPLIRLLLPARDKRIYDCKENRIGKALISALHLPPGSSGAAKLMACSGIHHSGMLINQRNAIQPANTTLTVGDVHGILDQLCRVSPKVEDTRPLAEQRGKILEDCISKMSPKEMKWLIRIILQDLRIGLSETRVLDALHPRGMDVFKICMDIQHTLRVLALPQEVKDGEKVEHEGILPGHPFRPQLCWRSFRDLEKVAEHATERIEEDPIGPSYNSVGPCALPLPSEFLVEMKMDGERIQLHMRGDSFELYSRKGYHYTPLYLPSFIPFLGGAMNANVEECIFDGEMLVIDPLYQRQLPLGTLKTYAPREPGFAQPRPIFYVFDIVYLKLRGQLGHSLIHLPLFRRKHLLKTVLTPKPNVIDFVESWKCKTVDDIKGLLQKIVMGRSEGLVVKNLTSNYHPGSRTNAWIKVKPEYMNELQETLDCLVVGMKVWEEGGVVWKSGFVVAVRDGNEQVDGQPCTFGFVGWGRLSREDIRFIDRTMKKGRRELDSPPSWLKVGSLKPDFYINPKDSFVIEISASHLIRSSEYGAGCRPYLARANKVRGLRRGDMDWKDAATAEEVLKMYADSEEVKFPSTSLRNPDLKAKRKADTELPRPLSSTIFEGLMFYVHNLKHLDKSKEFVDKDALQKIILENGGDYMQRIPDASPNRVVIASELKGVKNKAGAKDANILLPEWVLESVKRRRRLPMSNRFFVKAAETTRASSEDNFRDDESSDVELIENVDARYCQGATNASSTCDTITLDNSDDEEFCPFPTPPPSSSKKRKLDKKAAKSVTVEEVVLSDSEDDDDDVLYPQSALDFTLASGDRIFLPAQPGDPSRLFKHLVAYFDTSSNARLNRLALDSTSSAQQKQADQELRIARKAFLAHGGAVSSYYNDPNVTHVLWVPPFSKRSMELGAMKAPNGKYRNVRDVSWIQNCIDLGSPYDEDSCRVELPEE